METTVSVLELAKQAKYSPYLFARFIVEAVARFPAAASSTSANGKNANKPKKKIGVTDAMRDPKQILVSLEQIAPNYHASEEGFQRQRQQQENDDPTLSGTSPMAEFGTRLAYEVHCCMEADPMYGVSHFVSFDLLREP